MKLTCLVDNAVRLGSRFWGEHGLSILAESEKGRVLFDTGASGDLLLHNLQAARVPLAGIRALALSHAHRDHTGGLVAVLARRPDLPIHAHPDLRRERFARRGRAVREIGLTPQAAGALERADLRLSAEPREILPGIWTTGEITERPEPMGTSAHLVVRQGEGWAPDPHRDDLSLVLEGAEGLVLVCGCCHAGLLNTIGQVRRAFGRQPVAIVGGTHLGSAGPAHLRRVVEALQAMGRPALYANHCTGQAAIDLLRAAFGERVAPCPAGTVLRF